MNMRQGGLNRFLFSFIEVKFLFMKLIPGKCMIQ